MPFWGLIPLIPNLQPLPLLAFPWALLSPRASMGPHLQIQPLELHLWKLLSSDTCAKPTPPAWLQQEYRVHSALLLIRKPLQWRLLARHWIVLCHFLGLPVAWLALAKLDLQHWSASTRPEWCGSIANPPTIQTKPCHARTCSTFISRLSLSDFHETNSTGAVVLVGTWAKIGHIPPPPIVQTSLMSGESSFTQKNLTSSNSKYFSNSQIKKQIFIQKDTCMCVLSWDLHKILDENSYSMGIWIHSNPSQVKNSLSNPITLAHSCSSWTFHRRLLEKFLDYATFMQPKKSPWWKIPSEQSHFSYYLHTGGRQEFPA